jgi:hypothetical protein
MRARLLLFLALLASVACLLPPGQKASLLALFDATGGPYWSNNINWSPSSDPCAASWSGVVCDGSGGNVLSIFLSSNNLTGSLPDLDLPALSVM